MNVQLRPHEWEQLDQGIAHCVRCRQLSTLASPVCTTEQIPVATISEHDTLWREADRLARQMGDLSKRLYDFRDRLRQSTAS